MGGGNSQFFQKALSQISKDGEEEEIFLGQQLSKGLEERRLYVVDSPQCIVQAALSQQGCLWSVFVVNENPFYLQDALPLQ